uniref:SUR7/PalI family-domain-containing protein n=1 Tax=Strongyloides venezuelensis TaxID=75913 RepID=A0A0K0G498_STRVS
MVNERCQKVLVTLPIFLLCFMIALLCFYYGTYRFIHVLERTFNTTNIEQTGNLIKVNGRRYDVKEYGGKLLNYLPDSWVFFDKAYHSMEYISLLLILMIPASCFFSFLIKISIYIVSNLLFLGALSLTIFTAFDAKKHNAIFRKEKIDINIKGDECMGIFLRQFVYIIAFVYLLVTTYYVILNCCFFKKDDISKRRDVVRINNKRLKPPTSRYLMSKRSLIESSSPPSSYDRGDGLERGTKIRTISL